MKMTILTLITICFTLLFTPQAGARDHRIDMIDMKFKPQYLTIKKGDRVLWENVDESSHAITFLDEEIHKLLTDKRFLKVRHGQIVEFTFYKAGVFDYSCIPHTGFKMNGTITVVDEVAKAPDKKEQTPFPSSLPQTGDFK